MNEILTAISTVGFPIVASAGLGWYIYYLTQVHKEEMATIRASLDANTEALVELRSLVQVLVREEHGA